MECNLLCLNGHFFIMHVRYRDSAWPAKIANTSVSLFSIDNFFELPLLQPCENFVSNARSQSAALNSMLFGGFCLSKI